MICRCRASSLAGGKPLPQGLKAATAPDRRGNAAAHPPNSYSEGFLASAGPPPAHTMATSVASSAAWGPAAADRDLDKALRRPKFARSSRTSRASRASLRVGGGPRVASLGMGQFKSTNRMRKWREEPLPERRHGSGRLVPAVCPRLEPLPF